MPLLSRQQLAIYYSKPLIARKTYWRPRDGGANDGKEGPDGPGLVLYSVSRFHKR